MSKLIVHIPPVRETHDSRLGYAVVRGRDVENHETQLAQMRDRGYQVADVPDDGRKHTYWTIGAGARPCHACNSWYATDAEPRRNGTPGGDYEVTDAWNVRLFNDAIPGAVVDVAYFAERSRQGQSEVPAEPAEYGVTGMISYTTCTDRDDPGGTETWADVRYDNEADPLAYQDMEEADKAARFQAERWIANAAGFMGWDGQPFR